MEIKQFEDKKKRSGKTISTINYLLKHKLTIAGIVLGAIGGYLYYHFVGCASGTCSITSKPLNSVLYGAMIGGSFLNIFQKENNKTE